MPATDDDEDWLALIPPGTPVVHARHREWGVGVTLNRPVVYGQASAQFPNRTAGYYYPVHLIPVDADGNDIETED
jgi:hypothetical protein